MYATVRILRKIIYAAAEKGGNLNKLCAAIGIQPAELNNADKRVEGVTAVINLWKEVVASTGNNAFGLHLGEMYNPSLLGLLGYVMQNCPTLKDAFSTMQKYQELVSGWVSYTVDVHKDECEVAFNVHPVWMHASPETARQALEMSMGGMLIANKFFTDRKIKPKYAELSYGRAVAKAEYERAFQCAVSFNAQKNRFVYDKSVADIPVIHGDASLYSHFNQLLQDKMKEIGTTTNFMQQLQQVIIQDFQGQVPKLHIIAAHMNLSQRTFQRKLQLENESYRSVATKLKKELAFNLLKNSNATVYEISEVLGYTETSAFHRAYKTWTDTTPKKGRIAIN